MAFQANTSIAGHAALLGLIESFLSAQGWTINDNTVGAERLLYVSKANGGETFYFEMETLNTDNISLIGAVAHPKTADVSDANYLNLSTGTMPRAWFYSGDLYFHAVVEVATGYFQTFGFGRLTPAFTFSVSDKEGAFTYGSDERNWSSLETSYNHNYFSLLHHTILPPASVRAKLTSGVTWTEYYYPLGSQTSSSSRNPIGLLRSLPNSTGDRILMPVRIPVLNDPTTADDDYYMLGQIPGMAALSGKDLVNASTETIGADDWMKFPLPYHNQGISPVTDPMALAYKK